MYSFPKITTNYNGRRKWNTTMDRRRMEGLAFESTKSPGLLTEKMPNQSVMMMDGWTDGWLKIMHRLIILLIRE